MNTGLKSYITNRTKILLAALLLAGKPMLLVPTQTEQAMAAHRVASLGAARLITPDVAAHFPALLASALGDKAMQQAAQLGRQCTIGADP